MSKIWVPGDPLPPDVEEFHFFDWITDTIAITCYEVACRRDILDIESVKHIVSIGSLHPPKSLTGREPTWFQDIEDATTNISFRDITRCVDAIRTVHQNLPKSIHESKKRTLLVNDFVSDSCFTEIGFTMTEATARAFLSTGV